MITISSNGAERADSTADIKNVNAPVSSIIQNGTKVKERSPFSIMSFKERLEARSGYMNCIKELKNDIIDLCLNERRDICNRMDQLTDTIKKLNSEYDESSLSYGVELELTILSRKLSVANEDMCFIEREIEKKDRKLKQFIAYVIQLDHFYEEDQILADVFAVWTPQP